MNKGMLECDIKEQEHGFGVILEQKKNNTKWNANSKKEGRRLGQEG